MLRRVKENYLKHQRPPSRGRFFGLWNPIDPGCMFVVNKKVGARMHSEALPFCGESSVCGAVFQQCLADKRPVFTERTSVVFNPGRINL
ncbi:MAG TPA: hypothetical protein VF800_17725 [Telluria sp.]|jgi:hypothetical protein